MSVDHLTPPEDKAEDPLQPRGKKTDGLEARLAQLESAQLIHRSRPAPELEFIFRHALVQEAAYESLLKADRRRLHQAVANALEKFYPEQVEQQAPLLALHFSQAGDDDKALRYALLAAETASRIFAYAEASSYYQQAMEILSRLPDTPGNRLLRIDTTLKYADQSWSTDSPVQRLAFLTEMEPLLEQTPDGQGLPVPSPLRMRAQLALAATHTGLNNLPQALRYYRELLGMAEAAGEFDFRITANAAISSILVTQGYYRAAEPLLAQSLAATQHLPDRWEWGSVSGFLGIALAMRGRVAEGIAQIQDALARAQATHHLTFIAMYHLQLTLVYGAAEDWPRVLDAGRAATDMAEFTGDWVYACLGYASQALAESRLGQNDAAVSHMACANEIRGRLGGEVYLAHLLAMTETQIAFDRGRLDEAITRAASAVALARAIDAIFVEGYVHRIWAQALAQQRPPQWGDAEEHLSESLRALERGGATLEAARTRIAWAHLCRERGDAAAAVDHFSAAAAEFEAAGLQVRAEQVRQMARQAPPSA